MAGADILAHFTIGRLLCIAFVLKCSWLHTYFVWLICWSFCRWWRGSQR